MRDIFSFARKTGLSVTLGAAFGLMALSQAAEAANPLELNFWLSGPKYDGRLKSCEAALGTVTSQFQEKESTYWNSKLTITAYGRIHEVAYRPWQSDNIPRRYCSGDVQLSDGKTHPCTTRSSRMAALPATVRVSNGASPGLTATGPITRMCKAAKP